MSKAIFELEEIPQANDLTKVGMVAIAVSKNKNTFQEISKFIGFTDRQGRYYRKAAEILGLIEQTSRNHSQLTSAGTLFVKECKSEKDVTNAIKPYLLSIPLLREVYEKVSSKSNVDEEDILEILIELAGVKRSNTTIVRRLSTFVSWLKQAKMLQETEEGKRFKLLPIVIRSPVNTVSNLSESIFLDSILPYLYIPKKEDDANWEQIFNDYKSLKSKSEKEKWLNAEDNHHRFGRYVVGISSKEELEIDSLDKEIKLLEGLEKNHARLLVERARSLRFVTTSISAGGSELENHIENWLKTNGLQFERSYLPKGSEKNVDFFVASLNLAIESKFSKTSGTKHSGAITDLNEISKAKKFLKDLLVGVVLGGQGFEDTFFKSLEQLHDSKALDFVIPVNRLDEMVPHKIKRSSKFNRPSKSELEFESTVSMSWSNDLNTFEQGLYDSVFWLKKYSSISYLNFTAKLQTWMNQTPFAIECLRLILGWSETQMYNFVLNAVPKGIELLKAEQVDPEQVSLLIAGMNKHIAQDELETLESFFDTAPNINSFIQARIEAFDGVARKKHNTSKIFIELCKANVEKELATDSEDDVAITNGLKLQSHFSFKDTDGTQKYVHCRYYSGDGSVMSDLVKKIELLASSENAKDWIIIVDGAGWKKRAKDFRRLLEIAKTANLNLYNLSLWQARNLKATS
jgi:hypothetical protein